MGGIDRYSGVRCHVGGHAFVGEPSTKTFAWSITLFGSCISVKSSGYRWLLGKVCRSGSDSLAIGYIGYGGVVVTGMQAIST